MRSREMRRGFFVTRASRLGIVTATLLLHACGGRSDDSPRADDSTRAIAEEAYIFAFPLLESYKMLFALSLFEGSGAYEAPPNVLSQNHELLGADYTVIVRPNNDTFYSGVWLDLRTEPMVLSVPAVPLERYYSFQFIDMYTHNIAYVGSRATGPEAGSYLIAGPRWTGETPDGIDEVIRSETEFVLALARTAVFGSDDVANVTSIQESYSAVPLSVFTGGVAPPAAAGINVPPYDPGQTRSAGFVTYVNALLPYLDPHPSESELWRRFAAIGIGSDESSDPDVREAIDAGVAAALERIESEAAGLGRLENGWTLIEGVFGTREAMQGRYLTRSAAAFFGLFGNTLEEAYYPNADVDGDGDQLDGARHSYTLRFEADELPPAKSFWSLSMYKLPEQLFVHNPIDRYTIGDRTEGLQYGQDGSLTVYIQKESPGTDRVSNWLPAFEGPFALQMRIYWPEPDALDPLYVPPAIERVR